MLLPLDVEIYPQECLRTFNLSSFVKKYELMQFPLRQAF